MHSTKILNIIGGDPAEFARRVDGYQASTRSIFNLCVELEDARAKPLHPYAVHKMLTQWRSDDRVGSAPVSVQRGAIQQAAVACANHRATEAERVRRILRDEEQDARAVQWLSSLPEEVEVPTSRKALQTWLDDMGAPPDIRSAVLHQSQKRPARPRTAQERMRQRKAYEAGRHRPAMFFTQGVRKLTAHQVHAPGFGAMRVKGTVPDRIVSAQLV